MATDLPVEQTNALTRLLELALELGSERDLNGILKIATNGVCGAVGCERASLFIYDAEQDELYTRMVTALEISEIRHSTQKGIAGWVANHRQLLSVPIPANDARWDATVDRRTGFRTLNILAAPVLAADGQLLGVLQLLNKTSGFTVLDEQLVQAFAAHVAVALERQRLEVEAREAWELRQALEMGHRIQATFLPSELPEIPGYQVAAWWQPAEFVSGDYYDWLPLKAGRWGFAVGDVSGHGLAASLIMATLRAMTHVLARTAIDVHEFVETLRESITDDLRNSRFITCCYAILNPEDHEVRWANAGHAPAIHYSVRSRSCRRLPATTMPLGFPVIGIPQDESVLTMEVGDLLVLGTDGIVEIRNYDHQMYGFQRLDRRIEEYANRTAEEIVAAISHDVQNFQDSEFPPDDMTLVVIRRDK